MVVILNLGGFIMKKYLTVAAGTGLLLSVSSFGATTQDNINAIYISANAALTSTATSAPSTDSFSGTASDVTAGDFGWNVGAGYRFNQHLALEANYNQLQNINYTDAQGATQDIYKDVYFLDVTLKGIYQLNDKVDLFAKAGVAYVSDQTANNEGPDGVSIDNFTAQTNIVPMLGTGVSYAITPRVALDLGVNYIFASGDTFWTDSTGHSWSNTPDCLEGSAGLTYYFD